MNVQEKNLSREISALMWNSGVTVSTAESCTAGQISAALTSIPGSSTYYKGGVVCYTNEVKTKLLGVSSELIDDKGAVSEEVACEMVKGALQYLDTTYAVAVTGYAGPTAGDEAPVGTIWVAVGNEFEIQTFRLQGDEGRDKNLQKATIKALQMLLTLLKKHHPGDEE